MMSKGEVWITAFGLTGESSVTPDERVVNEVPLQTIL
jgi:hypothetical protein